MSIFAFVKTALSVLIVCSFPLRATLVEPMDLDNLLERSPIVLYAQVIGVHKDFKGYRTLKLLKKEVARDRNSALEGLTEVCIPLLNRVDAKSGLSVRVKGAPDDFEPKKEYLFFLSKIDAKSLSAHRFQLADRFFALMGFFQGSFKVWQDQRGVKRVKPLVASELQNGRVRSFAIKESRAPLLADILNKARSIP